MNCYNDWATDFMDRAIDSISGRLNEPLKLTEENAWRKRKWYQWRENGEGYYTYFWDNMITEQRIVITEQEYRTQSQPNL